MGIKRPVDSGRRDALDRVIRTSNQGITAGADLDGLDGALDADMALPPSAEVSFPPSEGNRHRQAQAMVGLTATSKNNPYGPKKIIGAVPGAPVNDFDDWTVGDPKVILSDGHVTDPASLIFDADNATQLLDRFADNKEPYGTPGSVSLDEYNAAHPETGYFTNAGGDGYKSEIEELAYMRDQSMRRILQHEGARPGTAPTWDSRSTHEALRDGSTYLNRITGAASMTVRLGEKIDTASDESVNGVAARLAEAGVLDTRQVNEAITNGTDLRPAVRDALMPAQTNHCYFGGTPT